MTGKSDSIENKVQDTKNDKANEQSITISNKNNNHLWLIEFAIHNEWEIEREGINSLFSGLIDIDLRPLSKKFLLGFTNPDTLHGGYQISK